MEQMEETSGVTDIMDAVERSYKEQSERLWHALVLFCGDSEVASDAVSEAFAQARGLGEGGAACRVDLLDELHEEHIDRRLSVGQYIDRHR